MNKKYQVFISSTKRDLEDERDLLTKVVLEMGHIPIGMEMFSASDDGQWKVIAHHIDEIDYYVVLVAHRYGTVKPGSGISYTETEYDYALSKGVPILGFVINDDAPWPNEKYESDAISKQRLAEFKNKITSTKLVGLWKNKDDLSKKFAISLTKEIKSNPRIGWVSAIQTEQEFKKLLSASDCISNIKEIVSRIHPEEKLVIFHFGLDMALASDYVVEALNTCKCDHIDYKILIMADNIGDLDRNPPSDVENWAAYVPASIKRIKNHINRNFVSKNITSKDVNIEIRQYFGTPILHGFKIISKTNFTFVSMCQYKGVNFDIYDWGEFAYRRICDHDGTPSDLHLASTFHGLFNRYWAHNSKVRWRCQLGESGYHEECYD